MLGNTKLYAIQDIERLKQQIAAYRETLITLKKGTSIEDYLYMKREFDGFKTQIAHLEGLTGTIDGKQSMQTEEYKEQVKQMSIQIDSLNQTVEEMNQEISLVLTRLMMNTGHEVTDKTIAPVNNNTSVHVADNTWSSIGETPQSNNPSLLTNKPPSFKQLKILAGTAIFTQKEQENELPVAHNENPGKQPEEHHFNHQYFQSISTHPSHIYNGLYRNATPTSTFHFKDESPKYEIPINMYDHTENPTIAPADEPANASVETAEAPAQIEPAIEEHQEVQTIPPPEELDVQAELSEEISVQAESTSATTHEDNKKEKHSLFFNIFRKWT